MSVDVTLVLTTKEIWNTTVEKNKNNTVYPFYEDLPTVNCYTFDFGDNKDITDDNERIYEKLKDIYETNCHHSQQVLEKLHSFSSAYSKWYDIENCIRNNPTFKIYYYLN